MSFVVPNDGDNQMLLVALDKATPETLTLHLFTNNITVTKALTTASFTELSGSGYAAITLAAASWTVTEGTGAGTTPTSATYPQQTFTLTGAVTVYGYFITGTTTGKCYFAEDFTSGAITLPSGGGTILITPTITSFS